MNDAARYLDDRHLALQSGREKKFLRRDDAKESCHSAKRTRIV
jgi:hypothetical protein